MSSSKKVFIETSVLVDYALKPDAKERIADILKEYQIKVSSNYVRMEIKKGVLTYLVYLHNKIANCRDWSEVQKAISNLSSTPQRHRLGTILEVLENFFRTIQNNTLPDIAEEHGRITLSEFLRKKSLSYIRLMIRILWRKFEEIVDEDINPMSCFIDIKPPERKNGLLENLGRTCNKSEFECKIKNFFRDNEESFQKILDSLQDIPEEKIDKETSDRIRSLKEILRLLPHNNRKLSNKDGAKECWKCSDAILAVVSPEGTHVLHHNPKHYNPICESINKTSVTY
jgi:uncharacterized protein YaaW (UPF0174 family)